MTEETTQNTTLKDKLEKLAQAKETPKTTEKLSTVVADEKVLMAKAAIETAMEQHEAAKDKKQYHVFYNTIQSSKMATDKGRVICFVGGKFITDQPEEIEYLNREIAEKNPYLYVKAGEEVMTSDQLDPMKALKSKIIEEYLQTQKDLAEKIAAGNLPTSSYEPQKLVPGNTATSVPGVGSNSAE